MARKPGRISSNGSPNGSAAAAFYRAVLAMVNRSRIPALVGGGYAVNCYTGINRGTKDIDIFCRAGDYPRILKQAADHGFHTEVEDERWIAKIKRGKLFCDVIFGSANLLAPVTDLWFQQQHRCRVFGVPVNLIPPTELILSKAFIMDRIKFDGNDIVHVILAKHGVIDWRRLLSYLDVHWEVLLVHILRFRYIYPFARDAIPAWLVDELVGRVRLQGTTPLPQKKACRGRVFSLADFEVDVTEWGFADAVGDEKKIGGEKR
ncbi:MAG: hypothetical protein WD749_05995 [Phycisphaerales bacterium]